MGVTVKQILSLVEEQAPVALALDWDRVGLQIGYPDQQVDTLVVALEPAEAVIQGALEVGAQMVLTHHPLFFRPLDQIRLDTAPGRIISLALKHGLALASAHTNLDIAPDGLNSFLAQTLELTRVEVLEKTTSDNWLKLAVFVPLGYEDRVRQGLFSVGAGIIGHYSHCSFATRGQGTYQPEVGANPWRGDNETLSRVEESRLEVLLPESRLPAVLTHLQAVHPYEEVAYDLYPLKNPGVTLGLGRIGELSAPRPFLQFVQQLKAVFGVTVIKVAGNPPDLVQRIAVCGGSGGDLIGRARQKGADVLVSGDIRYHQAVPWALEKMAICDAGHYATEAAYIPAWADRLEKALAKNNLEVEVIRDLWGKDPFQYF